MENQFLEAILSAINTTGLVNINIPEQKIETKGFFIPLTAQHIRADISAFEVVKMLDWAKNNQVSFLTLSDINGVLATTTTKQSYRKDWAIEKAMSLGVNEFYGTDGTIYGIPPYSLQTAGTSTQRNAYLVQLADSFTSILKEVSLVKEPLEPVSSHALNNTNGAVFTPTGRLHIDFGNAFDTVLGDDNFTLLVNGDKIQLDFLNDGHLSARNLKKLIRNLIPDYQNCEAYQINTAVGKYLEGRSLNTKEVNTIMKFASYSREGLLEVIIGSSHELFRLAMQAITSETVTSTTNGTNNNI